MATEFVDTAIGEYLRERHPELLHDAKLRLLIDDVVMPNWSHGQAGIACVDCHIGSGAPWFVRAKISGVRQLFAVNLKTYSRPIPSPAITACPGCTPAASPLSTKSFCVKGSRPL